MIRGFISIVLAVIIAFTSICYPASALTNNDSSQNWGGFWNWAVTVIGGAIAGETARILICTVVIPEFPLAAIPCGASIAAEATGAATAATSKAISNVSR